MTDGTYLSWEEVQRLMLPPNASMLIPPPPPEPADVPALAAGPPPKPDWLDYGTSALPTSALPSKSNLTITPEEARSAAEKAEHGPAIPRLLANVIAVNAVLNLGSAPQKKEDEEDNDARRRRKEDRP